MEFSMVADIGIIKETSKATNRPAACFSVVEIFVNSSSLPGFSKFLNVSDNHSFYSSSDLTRGLVRFELVFL